uniref:Membrane protein containing ATP-binding region, ATPase-like protein n=1 Tax=uncultured organism TaxID=155900 RepID=M1Q2D2_9ZZZZ|nr:membrane protein containing ATP-binding region, ATPase-like protein [uncultured organism]
MRVLLVDDEEDLLEQAKLYIEKNEEKIQVVTEKSVKNSFKLIKNQHFDAIVSDYQMPKIDGLEFLRILRKDMKNNVPFIIFTGKGREKVAIEALNLGADRYLQKGGDPKAQYGELKHAIFQAIERHQARKEIKKAEERYRKTIENAEIGIMIGESTGKIRISNSKMKELIGFSKDNLENLYKWLENTDKKREKRKIENKELEIVSETEKENKKEIKIFSTDKEEYHFILFKKVTLESDEVLLIAQNITENKKVEEMLEQQITDNVLKMRDKKGTKKLDLTELEESEPEEVKNRLQITKEKIEEMLKSQWAYAKKMLKFSLASWIFGVSVFAAFTVIYLGGFAFIIEALPLVISFLIGGLAVPIIISAILIGKKRKKIRKLDSIKSDLVSNYEKAIIASEKRKIEEKEEFLHSILRHDLKNKIQIIEGYHELLRSYELPKVAEEYVEKARKASKEGNNLIEKIRALRRVENGRTDKIKIDSVISKTVEKYQDQAEDNDIKIDYEKSQCEFLAGPLLEELFSNLIENCIKHANCSEIKISTRKSEDKCVISVEDDGDGIPDQTKGKIFEKGFKKGGNAGSGLGLSLVKEIAEGYKGKIKAGDSELGGAKFKVSFKTT